MENNTLEQMHKVEIYTECKECIFHTLNSPDDCYLDRLNKFTDKEIKEENGEQFYRINNRICNTYRTTQWADLQQRLEDELENSEKLTYYELSNIVYKEIEFSYDYIINLNDSTRDIELVKTAVFSALNTLIQPKSIVIVKSVDAAMSSLDLFRPFKNIKEEYGIKVSVEVVMDGGSDENKMNKAVNRCKAQYFIWQDDPFVLVTSEFIEKINHFLNVDMGRFVVLRDDFFSIYYRDAFNMVGANGERKAIDKLSELSTQQNADYLIKQFNTI